MPNRIEKNKKAITKSLLENEYMKSWRHGFKHQFKFDFLNDEETKEKFNVRESNFSWKAVEKKLMEQNTASSLPQLLRAGVQLVANDAYQVYGTTYEDWTTVVQSNKDTELYAPLHGITFPREVGRQENYPESSVLGLDISLKNKKFGTMLPIELELMQDDLTGQMQKQASLMGEYMKLVVEVVCYGKLASVSNMAYGGLALAATETKPTDEVNGYPYATSAAPFIGGGYNRPSSFSILSQASIQAGKTALRNQKNKLGLKMVINGNRLVIAPQNEFTAAILLNSSFYPTGTGTSGTGAPFAINPIKGIADLTMSPFVFNSDGTVNGDTSAWYLMDDSKPFFVVQMREAMIVEQEAVNAGKSFENDTVRYKARARFNADFIDSRFVWQGDDGSV